MIDTANLRIKTTKKQLTLNLLRKLHSRGIGTNSVEYYATRDSRSYQCGQWTVKEAPNFGLFHDERENKECTGRTTEVTGQI